jgi:energy-coupling factor transporter ATP-binding protein EcfA2
MLASLSIRDVVLIERLDLSFGPGLTALTGETGAGKSILLDALGLALGARAEAGLVRAGQAQASVAAGFAPAPDHPAFALLAEQGIEAEGEIVLRRVVSADGRSRAFVNEEPVAAGFLRRIGGLLVEVQGPIPRRMPGCSTPSAGCSRCATRWPRRSAPGAPPTARSPRRRRPWPRRCATRNGCGTRSAS